MAKFKGFSTINSQKSAQVLVDKDLAVRDLKNHFYTRVGSRLGEPEFGTYIYDYLFQPNDDITQNDVEDEVRRVINTDLRWNLISLRVDIGEHSITVLAQIVYNEDKTPVELQLNYQG